MKDFVHIIHVCVRRPHICINYAFSCTKFCIDVDSMLPLCNFRHQIFPSVEGISSIEEWHWSSLRREKFTKLHVFEYFLWQCSCVICEILSKPILWNLMSELLFYC